MSRWDDGYICAFQGWLAAGLIAVIVGLARYHTGEIIAGILFLLWSLVMLHAAWSKGS